MEHKLKLALGYFDDIVLRIKTFEVRIDDRNFREGDTLILEEWNQDRGEYTGRAIRALVTYILLGGQYGLEEGAVVMAIDVLEVLITISSGVHAINIPLTLKDPADV